MALLLQPPTLMSDGAHPITGILATAGVRFLSVFQSAHDKAGLGDHRYSVFDVDATSLLGVTLQHSKRPAAQGFSIWK